MSPGRAGAIAVGVALVVVAIWFATRAKPAPAQTVAESTFTLAITRHDAFGAPSKPTRIVDHARVQAILAALGVDQQPKMTCPPDYATADVGILFTGKDIYARKNAYVWDLAGAPRVTIVDETGCRGGTVASADGLRDALR